jgi:hypothetical protein
MQQEWSLLIYSDPGRCSEVEIVRKSIIVDITRAREREDCLFFNSRLVLALKSF